MGTSRLQLYNDALLILGERAIVALTDRVPSRRYLDSAWDQDCVGKVLIEGQWLFAQRTVQIDHNPNAATQFGHPYVFPKPPDFVRTMALTVDEFFLVPLMLFEKDPQNWYASVTPIFLKYVSNEGTTYGGNLAMWPPNFCEYVALWLACKIQGQLTGNRADLGLLEKRRDKALTRAQSSDAMEDKVKFAPPGTFTNARSRGRTGSGYDRGSRRTLIGF